METYNEARIIFLVARTNFVQKRVRNRLKKFEIDFSRQRRARNLLLKFFRLNDARSSSPSS